MQSVEFVFFGKYKNTKYKKLRKLYFFENTKMQHQQKPQISIRAKNAKKKQSPFVYR